MSSKATSGVSLRSSRRASATVAADPSTRQPCRRSSSSRSIAIRNSSSTTSTSQPSGAGGGGPGAGPRAIKSPPRDRALSKREHDLGPQTLGREGQFRLAVELVRGGERHQPGAEALITRWRQDLRAALLLPKQPETATAATRCVLAALPADAHLTRGCGQCPVLDRVGRQLVQDQAHGPDL